MRRRVAGHLPSNAWVCDNKVKATRTGGLPFSSETVDWLGKFIDRLCVSYKRRKTLVKVAAPPITRVRFLSRPTFTDCGEFVTKKDVPNILYVFSSQNQ